MHAFAHRLVSAALLAVCAGTVHAAPTVLAGVGPSTAGFAGTQSDGGTGPALEQGFGAPAGATLDKIIWWGYRLSDSGDADNFVVAIDGVVKSGVLDVQTGPSTPDGDLQRYTLDITDELLTGKVLSIINDVSSFEWYWQGGLPGAAAVQAFQLVGTTPGGGTVPEPSMAGLLALAAVTAGLASRRAVRTPR